MSHTIPRLRTFLRIKAQRVVPRLATLYSRQCLEFLEKQDADLIHVMTPDPAAMVMIRAGHAARIPVLYQELGIPYHPPDFESYYHQFTSVLPLCSEIVALSPRLTDHCREKLPTHRALSVLPII